MYINASLYAPYSLLGVSKMLGNEAVWHKHS